MYGDSVLCNFCLWQKILTLLQTNLTLDFAERNKDVWKKYFQDALPDLYNDESIKRQVKFLHILGTSVLDHDKLAQVMYKCFKIDS